MNPFRWQMPTEVVYGPGSLDVLAERRAELGERPLVVTGRGSARRNGALDRVLAQFPNAVVFDAVEENPGTETCEAGAVVCREAACDFVIAIGGGSPMDAAKAIAMLACNPGPCEQYFGKDRCTGGSLPVVAVPTTAGTGSEVTPYAVLTDHAQHAKRTIAGRALFPRLALLDPELSVTMPRAVTANTGLDALSQVMEGMVSRAATPVGDALGLETCRVIREWLPRAVAEPGNLEARGQMLCAAMTSGCIIAQSGTTLVHAMGYYFTLAFGLPHGLANALLLAPLFRYNADHVPEKVAAMATALGCPAGPVPADAKARIGEAVYALMQAAGVPLSGKDAGVDSGPLRRFAEHLATDRPRFKNQPGDPSVEDLFRLFLAACTGPGSG